MCSSFRLFLRFSRWASLALGDDRSCGPSGLRHWATSAAIHQESNLELPVRWVQLITNKKQKKQNITKYPTYNHLIGLKKTSNQEGQISKISKCAWLSENWRVWRSKLSTLAVSTHLSTKLRGSSEVTWLPKRSTHRWRCPPKDCSSIGSTGDDEKWTSQIWKRRSQPNSCKTEVKTLSTTLLINLIWMCWFTSFSPKTLKSVTNSNMYQHGTSQNRCVNHSNSHTALQKY